MKEGIYSGYLLEGKRNGAGTLVDTKFEWRMEGIWFDNKGFVDIGQKEYNDGEVKTGRFVNSLYQEVSQSLFTEIGYSPRLRNI